MLLTLHIENAAVIERGAIEFGRGLNVLTGETGAGKSIVIDALGAITGGRTGKELVRSGADFALISGEFDQTAAVRAWLNESGLLGEDEDSVLIVSRRISADGKSTCRVNGSPATVAQLRELGALLVDVHGQNDGQKLLAEGNHRAYLDVYGAYDEQVSGYRDAYGEYRRERQVLSELRAKDKDKELRIEELKRQISEIEGAKPRAGELDELLQRRTMLKDASKLTDALSRAYDDLCGSGDALGLLTDAERALSSIANYTDGVSDALRDARLQVEDTAERIATLRRGLDFSPEEQDATEARLSILQRLERRYGSVEECLQRLGEAKAELETLEELGTNVERQRAVCIRLLTDCKARAAELSASRADAASRLETRIAEELSALSMPGARFAVELTPRDLDANGAEDVRFLLSANAGEPLGRISKIASGGELSRIMLALKTVLTDVADTQVFDEIDAGVSGIAAAKVADKLREIAQSKQILCVTHLPQIAAAADTHFRIEKTVHDGRTFTSVTALDDAGRKEELSRLVGGDAILNALREP